MNQNKTKFLLIGAGILLGALLALPLLIIVPKFFMPAGSTFTSVSQLRSTIGQRDDRDIRADGSVSLRSILKPVDSDDIIYELLPNLDVRFQGVPVHTNAFGMRQQDLPRKKPPGTYRIALLGDSFAFGWGVERDHIFARVIEDRMNAAHVVPGQVEVLDFGVPGYSTFQEVAKLLQEDMDFEPDLVLVYFIDNDFGLPFFIGTGGGLEDSVGFVKRVLRGDDPDLQQQDKDLLNRIDANRALLRLSSELKARNVPLFLALNPSSTYDSDLKKLWALRRSKYIQFIPMLDRVAELIELGGYAKADLKLPNDPHPSATKHALLGQTISEQLISFLQGSVHGAAANNTPVPDEQSLRSHPIPAAAP